MGDKKSGMENNIPTEEQISIWLDYMTSNLIQKHFRPLCEVKPQRIQHWGKLRFPILESTWGLIIIHLLKL